MGRERLNLWFDKSLGSDGFNLGFDLALDWTDGLILDLDGFSGCNVPVRVWAGYRLRGSIRAEQLWGRLVRIVIRDCGSGGVILFRDDPSPVRN